VGEPSARLRVLVIEDHPLFRRGVVTLLDAVQDLCVAGTAASGEEAVDRVAELAPDVVLMDLQLPGMSGIEATRAILAAHPDVRVLVLTLFEDEESVFLALRAGARGYVLKDADEGRADRRDPGRAPRRSHLQRGGRRAGARLLRRRAAGAEGLSEPYGPGAGDPRADRRGKPNPAIARTLSLSTKTVANYVSTIFAKLQVADRGEAMIRAREAGFS
jgi:DNA-binding NarL/FixJ family response regulator